MDTKRLEEVTDILFLGVGIIWLMLMILVGITGIGTIIYLLIDTFN